ncbi:MAG: tripartite tricarboxylate transporter substrate binding protein [Burkholderiales bacterium]|nr:tripartite tricarboxylate transporter substrate binding protein [Burkholderiales bacterium]
MKTLSIALAAATLIAAHGASAQGKSHSTAGFPVKPVRLLVASAAGGGTDINARMLAGGLTAAWTQQVVVDNRSGAGGTIATDIVAKSQPDGHTLLFQSLGISYAPALYKNLPFDVKRDIAPVALVAAQPFVMAVHPGVPAKSVAEFIQLAKKDPDQVRYGSGGVGGASHLGTALLLATAGINITHVPYKGTGPAVTALLGNEVQMLIGAMASVAPHAKSGRVRMLAVTGSKRSAMMPGLPTVREAGLPGYSFDVWYGLFAPAKTPRAIVQKINADTNAFLNDPETRKQFARADVEPMGGSVKAFEDYMKTEMLRWAKVINEAGIRAN